MITKKNTIKHFFLLIPFFTICGSGKGQQLPDSIVIARNTYVRSSWADTVDRDSLYKTQTIIFKRSVNTYESTTNSVSSSIISDLLKELHDPDNLKNALDRYKIDTTWIKDNPEKVLRTSSYFKELAWNKDQKDLIFKELTETENYFRELKYYLNEGCCYTMHSGYRYEYILKFYSKNRLINKISSRKFIWGYRYPWTDIRSNKVYSYKIETILDTLLNSQRKTKEPLLGKKMLKYLVDKIVDYNMETLYKLSANSYLKEINELKSHFKIVSYEETYGYGGYYGDGNKIKVVLNNKEMLPNLNLEFLATKQGRTIYSRDSIIRDYKALVDKIQSIKFIMDYLKSNPTESLSILYFDNRPINQYNIDGVNKDPQEWKKHDQWLEMLKWDSVNNIKNTFDVNESIRTFKKLYCGCNYRFTNDFIENAITFVIDNGNRSYSVWYLLPDNTVLLYLMEGEKVLNYDHTKFGRDAIMQYPCTLFNLNGEIIPKKP